MDKDTLGAARGRLMLAGAAVGLAGLGAAWLTAGAGGDLAGRFFRAYFVALIFWVTISLGALFFVLLHHLTHAGWSVVVRRIAEIMAAVLPFLALLFVPVVAAGLPYIYKWAAQGHGLEHAAEGAVPDRMVLFHQGAFAWRALLWFGVWSVLGVFFWSRSVRQDREASLQISSGSQQYSAPGMVLFALTVSYGGIDLLMTVNPHWHSTIFGIYFFAGCVVGVFAALPLIVILLQSSGRLKDAVTAEHYHDLGKMLFAFIFFWIYIAFSQYMLIWYANLPEETFWFRLRASPEWTPWTHLSLVLLFGHWLIPFVVLMSRKMKRCKFALAFWCVWMLAMHYLDLFWLVMPEWNTGIPLGVPEIGCVLGIGGLYIAAAAGLAGRGALVPAQDPRLTESLAFENY